MLQHMRAAAYGLRASGRGQRRQTLQEHEVRIAGATVHDRMIFGRKVVARDTQLSHDVLPGGQRIGKMRVHVLDAEVAAGDGCVVMRWEVSSYAVLSLVSARNDRDRQGLNV